MTEIDVPIPSGQWTPTTQYQQASLFKGLLALCARNPICKSFETWGYTDKYTDIGSWQYPLPFDQVFKLLIGALFIYFYSFLIF